MFDARSDKGIFIGYSLYSEAYRVLNRRINYVEESVHMVFDELSIIYEVAHQDNDETGDNSQEQVTKPDLLDEKIKDTMIGGTTKQKSGLTKVLDTPNEENIESSQVLVFRN